MCIRDRRRRPQCFCLPPPLQRRSHHGRSKYVRQRAKSALRFDACRICHTEADCSSFQRARSDGRRYGRLCDATVLRIRRQSYTITRELNRSRTSGQFASRYFLMRDTFGRPGLQLFQHAAARGQIRIEFERAGNDGWRPFAVTAQA